MKMKKKMRFCQRNLIRFGYIFLLKTLSFSIMIWKKKLMKKSYQLIIHSKQHIEKIQIVLFK